MMTRLLGQVDLKRSAIGAVAAVGALLASYLVVQSTPSAENELRLGDGSAWLASTAIGGVSLLDGSSGSIATSLGVADAGDSLNVVEWGSDALIVNETTGTVGRLDATSWKITTGLVQFGEANAPLDVVVGQTSGWLVKPGSASPIDPGTLEQRTPVPLASTFSSGLVLDDGSLLVSGADADAPLRQLSLDGSSQTIDGIDGPTALHELDEAVVGVDLDDQRIWIQGRGIVCDRLEFPADATLSTSTDRNLLLVVADTGGMMMWDPARQDCPTAADFVDSQGSSFGQPAATNGWAAVPDADQSSITIVDLANHEIIATQAIDVAPGTEIQLVSENGAVWFNDPTSEAAGLIKPDGGIIPVAKYDAGSESAFVAAPIDEPGADDLAVAGTQQLPDEPEQETPPTPEDDEPAVAPPPPADDDAPADQRDDSSDQPDPEDDTPSDEPEDDQGSTPSTTLPDDTDDADDDSDDDEQEPDPDQEQEEDDESEEEGEGEDPVIEVRLASTALEAGVGEFVTFQSQTVHGAPVSWDFSTSPATAEQGPFEVFGSISYAFPTPGQFAVTVTACDADDNCDTTSVGITIVAGQVERRANIANPGVVTTGRQVSLSNANQGDNITSMRWTFGDGATPATSTDPNPAVIWDTPGDKTVTLTIEGPSSCGPDACTNDVVDLDTATRTISVVAAAPDYDIAIGGPTTVSLGDTVTYTASTSDPNGLPDPHWNVQGAGTVTPDGAQLSARWTEVGTYDITVATEGATANGAGSITVIVENNNPPASIDITCSPTTLEQNQFAQCSIASSANVELGGWVVNYPDPAKGSFTGAGITYDGAGTVQVSHWGTDLNGERYDSPITNLTFTEAVAVEEAPQPAISGSTTLDIDQVGNWSVTNSGGPVDSYSWSSSSGSPVPSPDGQSATMSWSGAGEHTISVTATGPGGVNSVSMQVTVNDPGPGVDPLVIACDANAAITGNWVQCPLSGDPSLFDSYSWSISWPDPGLQNSWAASAHEMHVGYLGTGTVTLTLTARHIATGQTVTSNTESIVYSPPPSNPPNVSIGGPASANVGEALNFSYSNSGGAITSVSWTADGQAGATTDAYSATWAAAGTYTVYLTASGPDGDSSTSLSVTINDTPPPPPAFGISCGASTSSETNAVLCQLTGNAADFTGIGWSVSSGSQWLDGGNPAANWVQGAAGVPMTVTVSATEVATGNPRSASASITWTP